MHLHPIYSSACCKHNCKTINNLSYHGGASWRGETHFFKSQITLNQSITRSSTNNYKVVQQFYLHVDINYFNIRWSISGLQPKL